MGVIGGSALLGSLTFGAIKLIKKRKSQKNEQDQEVVVSSVTTEKEIVSESIHP